MIYNPSNYGVSDLKINLRYDHGEVVLDQTVSNIEARSMFEREVELGKLNPGDYTLILEVDPQDDIEEFNETNNMISLEFTVLDRVSLMQVSSIPPGDIQASEGEWVNISAWSFRGEDPIPTGNWTIDGIEMDWDNHFNQSLPYLGDLSYREEPYEITYNPDGSYLFPDENGTLQWSLSVVNVNRAPVLISYSPEMEVIEIEEGQSVNLSVEVNDPDGTDPIFNWTTNGVGRLSELPSMVFESYHTGVNSSEGSPYLVNVMVTDPEDPSLNFSHQWEIIVIDVDRLPAINITPPPGELEVEHNGSLVFEVFVEDPDEDLVNATWYVQGYKMWNETHFTFSLEENKRTSDYYIALHLVLSVGSFIEQYNWTIHVLAPPEPEEPEPVPPVEVVIISPESGKEYLMNETITFEAQHADSRPLSFRWLINGSFYEGQEVTVSGLAPDTYTAVLNITTDGPPPGWLELEITFTVIAPSDGEVEEKDEKDDPFPWWIIMLIVIGIVVLIALLIFAVVRTSSTYHEE
jgi:hypothetical protein